MEKRVIIGIVLFVSMVLVMYPQVSSYLDLERSLSRLGSVPTATLAARDNIRSQIIGLLLLYVTVFLMLHFMRLRNGRLPSSAIEQASLPTTPTADKPLSKETTNTIFILSAVAFFVAYASQIVGVIMSTTTTSSPINFVTDFLMAMLYSFAASAIVGVLAYIIARNSNHSFTSPARQDQSLIPLGATEGQTFAKPEEADWYQQALQQHQVEIDETDDIED